MDCVRDDSLTPRSIPIRPPLTAHAHPLPPPHRGVPPYSCSIPPVRLLGLWMRNRRGDLRPRMLGHRETSVQPIRAGGSIWSGAVAGFGGRDDVYAEVSASCGGDE